MDMWPSNLNHFDCGCSVVNLTTLIRLAWKGRTAMNTPAYELRP